MTRISWAPVLAHARGLVESYSTGVTLRQLFYRLVADGTLPNLPSYYKRLSEMTAKARRAFEFPDLLDRQSRIERRDSFGGSADALAWLRDIYRRDRTEGQECSIYLGVEKAGLSEQLDAWFGDPLGLPILALGGYASQTLVDEVQLDITKQRRPSTLIYGGDFDPTGEDIDRDFEERVGVFDKVTRVALRDHQVRALPRSVEPEVVDKLHRDPRAARFMQRHRAFLDEHFDGKIVQFEVDALPPETLQDLYRTAIGQFWDDGAHRTCLAREAADLDELRDLHDGEQ